jgi:hypothetical protein
VARKKDAEEDFASKAILDQLNTKTVGPPLASTGLTGDQLPETIFKVDDFDQVRNQITLQLSNLEALNMLNTVGQITNMQSQSGPIPNTCEIVTSGTMTGTDVTQTLKTVPAGQVFQIMEAEGKTTQSGNTPRVRLYVEDGNGNTVELGDITLTGSSERFDGRKSYGSVFIDENLTLKCQLINGSTVSASVDVALVRVR